MPPAAPHRRSTPPAPPSPRSSPSPPSPSPRAPSPRTRPRRLAALVLAALVVLSVGCVRGSLSASGPLGECTGPLAVSAESGPGGATVRWNGVDCRGSLEIRGEVELAEGASAEDLSVVSLAAGAVVEGGDRVRGAERRLRIAGGDDGGPRVTWRVGGETVPLDAEGEAWLSRRLLLLLRETGYGAEARVARLLDRGGATAVLGEVEAIGSDAVQRRYVETALVSGRLAPAEVRQAVAVAARSIGSDGELSALLVGVVRRLAGAPGPAADADLLLAAVADATRSIGSDGDCARVLAAALDAGAAVGAGPDAQAALLTAARDIGSDGDLAGLLTGALDAVDLTAPAPRAAFAAAAAGIGSDGDLAAVLTALARRPALSAPLVAMLLDVARSIGSDGDLASVLVAVAGHQALDGELREAYLRTASTLGSQADHRRAVEALRPPRRASIPG